MEIELDVILVRRSISLLVPPKKRGGVVPMIRYLVLDGFTGRRVYDSQNEFDLAAPVWK